MLANIASLAQSAISPTIPLVPHQRIPVLCSPKQRRVLRSRESRAARRASNQHSLLRSRRLVASFCLGYRLGPRRRARVTVAGPQAQCRRRPGPVGLGTTALH
jgi:hypothetical protein